MHRFFATPEQFAGEFVRLTGEEARHLRRVLRLRPGDQVNVFDGEGREYLVEIEGFVGNDVQVRILAEVTKTHEAPLSLALAQGLAKGEKLDLVIQKATEVGVRTIIPVHTARSVPRPGDGQARREERWQRIAREAAKQCGRAVVPSVKPLTAFSRLCERFAEFDAVLFLWEEERARHLREVLSELKARENARRLLVIIGPEGGLTPEEAHMAVENGAVSVTLGPRILRTETAGLVAASIILYELGDLG